MASGYSSVVEYLTTEIGGGLAIVGYIIEGTNASRITQIFLFHKC